MNELEKMFQSKLQAKKERADAKKKREEEFKKNTEKWSKMIMEKYGFLTNYGIKFENLSGYDSARPTFSHISICKPCCIGFTFAYALDDPLNIDGVWEKNVILNDGMYYTPNNNKLVPIDKFLDDVIKNFEIKL